MARLALLFATLVWGATFVVVERGIADLPVFHLLAYRFGLGAVLLAPLAAYRLRRRGRRPAWRPLLRDGGLIGVLLFAGYAFQTIGLQYTQASNAGFVTGMFVVFTPLLSALLLRALPGRWALVGVALATVGLGLLSLGPGFRPASGDVLILGCAVAFAAHIVGLGAWSSRHDAVGLTVVQLLVSGVCHSLFALAFEVGRQPATWDRSVVVALLVTAVLASAAAFWIQTAAQRVIPPTRTAVILTMEPVFAGVFGFLLLDEGLTARGWLGCALILAGMLAAELGAGAPPPIPPEEQASTVPAT
jgi:drug/metabolite transporter (DMT)-like permease